MSWAIKWISNSPLDGHREYLCRDAAVIKPAELGGYKVLVFKTRDQARAYIKRRYGYICHRPDLKSPPHCWKMPQAVRVKVEVTERP